MREDKPMARERARKGADAVKERVATHGAASAAGAVGGAVAGAVSGIAAGPLGSLVGAVSGAAAGAAAGASTGAGAEIDTTPFEAYWRDRFHLRPYAQAYTRYEDWAPAYRYAIREYIDTDHPRRWDEVEHELARYWPQGRGESDMPWSQAMPAVRDAWHRMYDPFGFEEQAPELRRH